ncbi:hypothetical protein ACLB2K_020645 [Fragaria x ananassa]
MGEVDPAFVQAIDQRPKLKPTILVDDEIPVIDLSVLSSSHGDTKQLVSKIGHACQKWGFFQVVNHGVPLELFERMEEVDMTMLPASHEPDDKELRILTNQWPQYPSEFREVCQEYAREVEKLAYKLLGLIALSLGQPENKFNDFFKEHQTSLIRFNHYPPCPFPHLALGVGRHKDAGALTVLAQDDVGGLEVRRKSVAEWIPVTPTPNAYIINAGDMVQVWSNDKYESVEHRVVVNREKERFSIPFFFFCPAHHVMVKPLDELLNDDNPAKYREYNWGKFFAMRNRSDFKKLDVENIQIHHFRLPQ